MNLFVNNFVLGLCLTLFPVVPDAGRAKCTCRPSPPGGVTQCQSGQIAVCNPVAGVCTGSCINLSAQLQPLQYSAELLKNVLGREVPVKNLEKDPKRSKKLLDRFIEIGRQDQPGEVEYEGTKYLVCFGLTAVAISKLKAAGVALVTGKKAEGKKVKIPVPLWRP